MTMSSNAVGWLVASLALALGAVLLWITARALYLLVAMPLFWPRAEGVVQSAEMVSGGAGAKRRHRARFLVNFTHQGRRVEAVCDDPLGAAYRRDREAERDRRARSRGTRVRVYVNPRDPERSYLDLPPLHIVAMLMFATTTVAGFGSAVVVGLLLPDGAARYWKGWIAAWEATLAVALVTYLGSFLWANRPRR